MQVILRIKDWIHDVSPIYESRHTYERVRSLRCMSHITRKIESHRPSADPDNTTAALLPVKPRLHWTSKITFDTIVYDFNTLQRTAKRCNTLQHTAASGAAPVLNVGN